MSDIARNFHTTTEEIRRLNPGAPLISISYNPGMEIRVPWGTGDIPTNGRITP